MNVSAHVILLYDNQILAYNTQRYNTNIGDYGDGNYGVRDVYKNFATFFIKFLCN